ncbi:glycine/betaine ABC transporter [Bacillaceae bacterium JMAK1]|nr:glycine/betaine ABC transporter [Bacillaceae bacterium JMAK1]
MKKFHVLTASTLAIMLLTACGDDSVDQEENENASNDEATDESASGDISIGFSNYAESTVISALWGILLEEQGYDVTLNQVEKAFLFSGVENSEIDLGFAPWLPFTDQAYVQLDSEVIDVQEDGVLYEGTEMGLVVPEYMEDLNTIEDLQDYVDELEGTITGIDGGASLTQITEDEVMDHYGLDDFELLTSSEQAMVSALDTAYNNEEPIVVTLWSPHWTFGEYDLKYLEDPDAAYGEDDDIYYIARNGLQDEQPEVIDWINNSYFDDDQLSELLLYQSEEENDEAAAKRWIENNQDYVDSWFE